MWIDRGSAPRLNRAERSMHVGLLGSVGVAVGVALAGVSGIGPQPVATAALGVALATCAGIAISANTIMCRRLNDAGVSPATLVAVRFLGATVAAAILGVTSPRGLFAPPWSDVVLPLIAAALALIVFPIYVNQVSIALASPVTVRAVLALAPVLIFLLQILDGRLTASLYSLGSALLYSACAVGVAIARGRAIASTPRVLPAPAAATASSRA